MRENTKKTATQEAFEEIKNLTNLSDREMRKITGLQQGNHNRYKNGKTTIGYDKLFELAKKLGIIIKFEKK